MEVVILGSGTGEPFPGREAPGILVRVGEEALVFDLGPGTLRQLAKAGVDHRTVEQVFFTHLHVDHVGDLAALLFVASSIPPLRERPLHLSGPKGFRRFLDRVMRLYGPQVEPKSYRLLPYELWRSNLKSDGWGLSSIPLRHMGPSIGYRIEAQGRVVAYSGDTGYCREVVELLKDADLGILECSFPEGVEAPGHLTPSLAGRIGREANCKHLVLVHLYPICEVEKMKRVGEQGFDGQLTIAADLLRIQV